MKLRVILQPFAGVHRERFWGMLERQALHPLPLSEAWEIHLSEEHVRELMVRVYGFDIIAPEYLQGKPFVVIELDTSKFKGQSDYERAIRALARLNQHREFVIADLPAHQLFKGVERRDGVPNRLAWLCDGAFWAYNEPFVGSLFEKPLSKAA